MNELDIATIKKKSYSGIVALTSRTFLLQLLAFAATFLLTIFLSPSVFGVFYVVSAIISFLGYFSDIGLAAALIQKKEELTGDDLTTTFTIQQLLVGILTIVALAASPAVASFYRLDTDGLWLFCSLVISFFLSSLKTIPSVLLERKLNFQKLVIPQIAETVGFYTVAVVLAWRGFGVASFTWAVLTRGIIGLVVMYILAPWHIGLGISRIVAKRLIKFGLPFQTNSLLALVKDDLLTVFLGRVLPFAEVGYIGWAKKWAEVPLRLIMDSVMRVTFPAFSRIQEAKEVLGRAIERTLFGLSLLVFPISIGLLFFIRPFIDAVPRYEKWEPALFSFYLFTIGAAVSSLSTPLTNALNAIGKIKTTLLLMIMWTTTTWVLTVLFVRLFGFNGVALALLIITSSLWIVIHVMKQYAAFSFWKSVRTALLGVLIQGFVYWTLLSVSLGGALWYGGVGLLGVILYGAVVWTLERHRIQTIYSDLRKAL